jgi:hypothetical protein
MTGVDGAFTVKSGVHQYDMASADKAGTEDRKVN